MNKFLALVLIGCCLLACKPYQSTTIIPGEQTYTDFRATQKAFTTTDGVIKYIDKGSGPVVVLLHGVPSSGWLYRTMIDPIVDAGYRVIVPDMLGYGSSDSPKGYEIYSEQQHAKRLLELMDGLNIDHWSHVMHDAGGLWTWELFLAAPNRIKKLMMLNTLVLEEGFHPPIRFRPGPIAKISMWSYRNGITTNVLLKKLFQEGLKENTLNKVAIEGYKKPLLEGKTRGMYYFFTKTCNHFPDYYALYERLTIPVGVIWGIHDTMLQWKPQQDKIIEALGVAKDAIYFIDEKHFIQETQGAAVAKNLLSFLKSHP